MSAIGDYIHLTAEGYSTYGIAKNNKYNGKATELGASICQQKKEIFNIAVSFNGPISNFILKLLIVKIK